MNTTDNINLKVISKTNEVLFKIGRQTPMSVLIVAYCQRNSLNPDYFFFKVKNTGRYILPDDTCSSLGLHDKDIIEVS